MKLEVNNDRIEFSVDNEGEVEYVFVNFETKTNPELVKKISKILRKVISDNLLEIGERSEGLIIPNRRSIIFDYKVCIEVGEDWNTDKWRCRKLRIPNV